ncbi:MAG: hypothetical protein ACRDIZ_13190 [Actinomycetota bacterium]
MRSSPSRWLRPLAVAAALVLAVPAQSTASHNVPAPPDCDEDDFLLSLDVTGTLQHVICSGDTLGGFEFPGIPDGIGIAPGADESTINVFVNHEESDVPFPATGVNAQADFQDSSVSKVTLDAGTGELLAAEVALPASAGFMRLCSSFMAGPDEGFSRYTYLTGEETNDVVAVEPGAPYGADPSVAPNRQGGLNLVLDAEPDGDGDFAAVPGMGRHNHENTVPVPGGWNQLALLSTDDTFTATTSQLYLYLANHERHIWQDKGSLWGFQVTRDDGVPVDPFDPFNGANDYLDLEAGEEFQGRFIRVPKEIAMGTTAERPQDALENWSNANNVFQFVRLEDLDYDRSNPRVVYIADTGASGVVPNPATGRMHRPGGVAGQANNGSIFRMEFDAKNPRKVDSLTLLHDADSQVTAPGEPNMRQPDNMGVSQNSLMIQEDTSGPPVNSRIWRFNFATEAWDVVATVNENDWESSGIVDASGWLWDGTWIVDVQGHGNDDWVAFENETPTRPWHLRQESGQLLIMTIPGS